MGRLDRSLALAVLGLLSITIVCWKSYINLVKTLVSYSLRTNIVNLESFGKFGAAPEDVKASDAESLAVDQ